MNRSVLNSRLDARNIQGYLRPLIMTVLVWLLWLLLPTRPAPEARNMAVGETNYRIHATYVANGVLRDKIDFDLKEIVLRERPRGDLRVTYEIEEEGKVVAHESPLRELVLAPILASFGEVRGMSLIPGPSDLYGMAGDIHKGLRLRDRYITWITGTESFGQVNRVTGLYSFDYSGNLLDSSITGTIQVSRQGDKDTFSITIRRLKPKSAAPREQAPPHAQHPAPARNTARAGG